MAENKKKTSLSSIVVIIFLCLCIISILSYLNKGKQQETAPLWETVTAETQAESAVTEIRQPTEPQSPTAIPAFIPGISPVNVTLNLENRNFICSAVEKATNLNNETFYVWHCEKTEGSVVKFVVNLNSRQMNSVDYISAAVLQTESPSDQIASTFLGYMATIPFIGSAAYQLKAKTWIEVTTSLLSNKVSGTQSVTMNGIQMKLYGLPESRSLEMGEIK